MLVCSRHHTLIHQHGFQLALTPDRTLTVRTSNDIPHHPHLPGQSAEGLESPANPYTSERANDRFDLGYIVTVMAAHTS